MRVDRTYQFANKKTDIERAIGVQFNVNILKVNILKNCKKLKAKPSILEGFPVETAELQRKKWKDVLAKCTKGKISYPNADL